MYILLCLFVILIVIGIYLWKKNNKEKFKNFENVFVINMDGENERLKIVTKRLKDAGFKRFERFPAVDGKKIKWDKDMEKIFDLDSPHSDMPKTNNAGVFGCALSHLRLWEKIAQKPNSQIFLILEDDVIFFPGFYKTFENISKNDFDLFFLGIQFHESYKAPTKGIYKLNKENSSQITGGTYCYAITPKGASKLVQIVKDKRIHRAIDWFLIDYFHVLNVYCINPLLATFDSSFKSSIQNINDSVKDYPK